MGENHFDALPVAIYGVPLLMAGVSYSILCHLLIRHNGRESTLARVLDRDWKARISTVAYIAAIPLAFVLPSISLSLYIGVATLWLAPDPRIEKTIAASQSQDRQ